MATSLFDQLIIGKQYAYYCKQIDTDFENEHKNLGIKKHKALKGPEIRRRKKTLGYIANRQFLMEDGNVVPLRVMLLERELSDGEENRFSGSTVIRGEVPA